MKNEPQYKINKETLSMSFTIVTPNYNMGKYLGRTIESVIRNIQPGDEYFIVDGGSSDESLEIIRSYEDRITGWVSEPDAGYADAVAKGFRQAGGRYLCWVNSGDLLLDGALAEARAGLERTNSDLIFGDDLLIDEVDKVIQVTNGQVDDLRKMMLYAGWTPLQESCFWSRELYQKIGGIDPNVKFAADYDFFLRMSIAGRCNYIPAIFGAFRRHEGQLSIANMALYKSERERCQEREFSNLPKNSMRFFVKAYYWLKVRLRAHLNGKKRSMNRLVGYCVSEVLSQSTNHKKR